MNKAGDSCHIMSYEAGVLFRTVKSCGSGSKTLLFPIINDMISILTL
jgi:hypothetical protein